MPASPDPPSDSATNPRPALASTFNRLQPSPETVVLILAIVIGSGTGLAVVLFRLLIEKIHSLMMEDGMGLLASGGAWTLACVPVAGGAIVGLMRWRWQEFGPSISSLISKSQSVEEVLPGRSTAKAIAAAVSLGAGASLGPEGPSVEIGANLGVLLAQALQVSQERLRLLLGAGAAAGLAAGFNAPIAGVFFALEVVLGTTFATSAVSLVLLAAVVSALIAQIAQGGQPAFLLPAYEVRSPLELPLYLGLGLSASLVSIAYTRSVQLAQSCFQGKIPGLGWMGRIPLPCRPIVGGLCIGLVALQFPQIMGIGYETVEAVLRDVQFSLPLLTGLLLAKLAMTAVSLGSGFVGGLFAPAMFLGATLGAAYGKVLPLLLPIAAGAIAAPPAYAMVGMAAVLAASARAPLTAILLLFELTHDYRIILPLMAAVSLSVWLVERLKPLTRTAPTVQSSGLKTEADDNAELLQQLPVAQAMHQNFLTLASSLPVLQAGFALTRHRLHSALVVDELGELTGIVTLQDINRTIARWQPRSELIRVAEPEQTLGDICTQDVLYVYEDEKIAEAVSRMAARGLRQLPVVDRQNSRRILGLLEKDRIALTCSLAATREALSPYLIGSSSSTEPAPETDQTYVPSQV
ncbi:MAG TPA: chloride channel protein [Thermosynechococcaceae cyanobacterium]